MFLGHYGVALASKRLAPKTSFGTLFFAAEFADCLWPLFLLLQWEHVRIAPGITRITPFDFVDYPTSHSLLMDVVWAALFGGIYYAVRRYRAGAIVVALAVLSHWVLDWISHRPDMPLTPWSQQKHGLGLWNSVWATLVVELVLFFAGLWIYLRTTRAKDRVGSYALWAFVILMLVLWLGATFGPPPPDVGVLKWSAPSIWLVVVWAYWIDRHRK
jgi:LexA-binding, inner membrane-associated putative hydrolase